jgi:hypothetical protein
MLTVLQSSALTNLATVAAARAACGVTGSGEDAAITAFLTRASAAVAGHCKRAFGPTRYRQRFRFRQDATTNRDRERLLLARRPVITDTTLMPNTITAGVTVSVDGVALSGSDFEVDPAKGHVLRLSGSTVLPWAGTVVSVDYPSGYGMPTAENTYVVTLPADVTEVCLDLVAAAYASAGRDSAVQSEQSQDVGRITYFDRGSAAMSIDEGMAARLFRYGAGRT